MPQFTMSVPHTEGKATTTERLKGYLQKVEEHYGGQVSNLQQTWTDNQLDFAFSTFGIKVDGKMVVEDDKVDVTCNLPLTAMMFKGKIESGLKEQLVKLLK